MKKYRIVKYNRIHEVYIIQKRVFFGWFNTDVDGDIVIPLFNYQYVWEYETLEMAREALKAIIDNQKKEIIDEV